MEQVTSGSGVALRRGFALNDHSLPRLRLDTGESGFLGICTAEVVRVVDERTHVPVVCHRAALSARGVHDDGNTLSALATVVAISHLSLFMFKFNKRFISSVPLATWTAQLQSLL